jgi:hypothetical protein
MLHEAGKQSDQVRGLKEELRRSGRGLDFLDEQQPRQGQPLPHYYWAAFILSGDWR